LSRSVLGEPRGEIPLGYSTAPAQVRGDHLADLLLDRLGTLGEEPFGEHQEPGGAEPALQRVVFGERPLQVAEFTAAVLRQ
jgi:hypothetical protein